MEIVYFMVFGIAIFGGSFVKSKIFGIPLVYISMAILFIQYIVYLKKQSGVLKIDKRRKKLCQFVLWGLLYVAISIIGVNEHWVSNDLFYDRNFVLRQSYYLFILPAQFLFKHSSRIDHAINKYGFWIFIFVYLARVVYIQDLAIGVSSIFVLSWLALQFFKEINISKKIIVFSIIVFSPIGVGGEMTNVIFRLIFIFVLFRKQTVHIKNSLRKLFSIGTVILLVSPLAWGIFGQRLDANSSWRMRYWRDEIIQVYNTNFVGVGYGTSYASTKFVGDIDTIVGGPFGATEEYSTMDRLFVTGPHNSFISIFFRLGIIGYYLFVSFIYHNLNPKYIDCKAKVFAAYAAIVLIMVNVGLESPYYLYLFVFAMGIAMEEKAGSQHLVIGGNKQ